MLRVVTATALSPNIVKVEFSGALDRDCASNFEPATYDIAGLAVSNVDPYGSSAVILQTAQQTIATYTVVVDARVGIVRGVGGVSLDPANNAAEFLGGTTAAVFYVVSQSPRKLRINFSEPMSVDAEFTNGTNYELEGFAAPAPAVSSVEALGADGTRAEVLLDDDLVPFASYSLRISSAVKTLEREPLFPHRAFVRWEHTVPRPIRLRIADFSGEVSTGLLGAPAGQVFFSPAFEAAAAASLIEVEQVKLCTKAYDVYRLPQSPAYLAATFLWPRGAGGGGLVLWGPAHRIGQPTMALADLREDSVSPGVDAIPEGILVESIDITRAAFLNDARWRLFPGTGASHGVFRTADNAMPIGPGPTTGPFTIG